MSPTGREKVTRTGEAEVVAVWIGSEKALLRELATQQSFEATAPPEVARFLHVGVRVTIYRDGEERIVGWYLPDEKLGVREDLPDGA